ncbi:MAG TPA: hypothetical protein VF275_00705 [Gammaproteobacteria bacterium]
MLRFFITLIAIAYIPYAAACSCERRSGHEIWPEAKHIFVADITQVRPVETGSSLDQQGTFDVVEVIKGEPTTVPFLFGSSSAGRGPCLFDFNAGDRFLVVTDDTGILGTCSGSGRLGEVDDTGRKGLWVEMLLERFRAIATDESAQCTYAQSSQIDELSRWWLSGKEELPGWELQEAALEKRRITFSGTTGQKMDVTYGGCDHLGYSIKIYPVVDDLDLWSIFSIASELPRRFWDDSDADDLVALLKNGEYEVEDSREMRLITLDHPDLYMTILYNVKQGFIEVSYLRTF